MNGTKTQTKPFADDARSAVFGLRRALADILSSVDADPDQPQEISRRFGLDKTLTWRIARVIRAEDPWEAVPHIPRRPSIGIFTRAMTRHGAPADRVTSVIEALNQFERCVEIHSGDRETLEMMLGVQPRGATAKRMEAFRKSGFQANSAIWGVRARLQVGVQVMAPSKANGHALAMSTACGLVDFRRLRADVPWAIAALSHWDKLSQDTSSQLRAIDSSIAEEEPPLLTPFCSSPLPLMREMKESPTLTRYMLAEGPVGNTAAATAIFGWYYSAIASKHESYPGEEGEHGVVLSTPVETVIQDLYIHRSLGFAFNPKGYVYSQLPGGPRYPEHGRDASELPVATDVVDLGEGPPDTTTPELHRFGEIVDAACRATGYEVNEFRGYRFRIKYPPIPAIAILRHKLLPAEPSGNGTGRGAH
ncbi:MAG: hypothetical protein IT438_14320 [Phycisphaerales bacterium]|nr:hypothetical protein [Phycisphaerales bacterium]